MSGSLPGVVSLDAPAKLNLGLEVLGYRDDGYHEIATIFLAIDLYDSLTLTASDRLLLRCDDPRLEGEENLVLRALRELLAVTETASERLRLRRRASPSPPTPSPVEPGEGGRWRRKKPLSHRNGPGAGYPLGVATVGVRADLVKRIPVAAGLGGASSDAAAALRGGRELWGLDLSDEVLLGIAARLGSDVPFFLAGGCALGQGRGEVLTPLPAPRETWFVVVAPRVEIPAKTATLYAGLTPVDFSDGARVAAQAERLRAGRPLDPALLGNAFDRALSAHCPELADLPAIMRGAGAPHVAISGAGSAHYAVLDDPGQAASVADRLRERLGAAADIVVCTALSELSTPTRPL